MGEETEQELALYALLETAKRNGPQPSPAFMARLVEDMANSVPSPATPIHVEKSPFEILTWLQRAFTASGLAGAAALGVWIGFVNPDTLNSFAGFDPAGDSLGIEAFLPTAGLTALEEED